MSERKYRKYRKLRKLIRNPRQFFFDSKYTPEIIKKRILHIEAQGALKKNVGEAEKLKTEPVNYSFDLNSFKKDINNKRINYNQANKIIMDAWVNKPWHDALILGYVFLLEKKDLYLEACNFLELAIKKKPTSIDVKLQYVMMLKKSGIYNIRRTIEIVEGILEKRPNHSSARYFLCQFLWESQGTSPLLYDHISYLKKDFAKLSFTQQNFVCACLYELGRYTDVDQLYSSVRDKILRKYFTLEMYFEYKFEGINSRVEKYNSILEFQRNFELSIKEANKLAVVGNAPCELGLNKGSLIDNSDIIIRFNNFVTGGDFAKDYGFKTDYWVKGGFFLDIQRKNIADLKGIIQSGNNTLFRNTSFDDFLFDADITLTPFFFIPPKVYYDLIGELNVSPSAGLSMLYWIYLIRGKVPRSWVFGFSFGSQVNNRSEHYFNNYNEKRFYPHNWDKEAIVLNNIIDWDK